MKAIHDRPQVYTKVSEVLRRKEDGTIPRISRSTALGSTKSWTFSEWTACSTGATGERRSVAAGSGWIQDRHEYFMAKGQAAAEKYFWRNSIKAYKWVKRNASQRQA